MSVGRTSFRVSATSSNRVADAYSAHFLLAEFIEAIVIGVAFTAWMLDYGGIGIVNAQLGSNWPTLFATLATVFGALFGFVVTTNSIAVSLLSDKVLASFGTSSHADDIWETLLQTNLALGVGGLLSLAGLELASDGTARPCLVIALFFVGCFALVRLARTVWIIDQLPRTRNKLARRFNQSKT